MGTYGDNKYRNRIRRKYKTYGFVRILYFLIIIAIIYGGVYYIKNRTDLVSEVKEQSYKNFEEIVGHDFSEIGKVIKKSNKTIVDINAFINKYKGKIYKKNTYNSLQIMNEIENYYVYGQKNDFIYEICELENGSIRVQTMEGSVIVYDIVQE